MIELSSGSARIAELEADNRRLRRLLDERGAPSELRHRLRNTAAMLRTIIRKSLRTGRGLEDYAAHLEDRLDALMRAQAAADERGMIEIHNLLADELLHYDAPEGERATLSGPDVELQPQAGQVLALAIHELAVNSVEHGALGTSTGRIEVDWDVATRDGNAVLALNWRERDTAPIAAPGDPGFGTEVLTRTLPYELNAETSLAFEPDGLRCTITFPLPERVGRVSRH